MKQRNFIPDLYIKEIVDMTKQATGMLCYVTWIGWLIAFLAGDREGAKFHLNQGLVLAIAALIKGVLGTIGIPGLITGLLGLAIFVLCVMGIYQAYKGEEKELPIVGAFKLLN